MRRRSGDLRSQLSNEELFRATGASLIHGNHLRILWDAQGNYPAWEAAIQGARKTIHMEMYVIHNDKTGRHFRDLLVDKARQGVKVRVIYDWFGSLSLLGRWMWKPLREAGGEVRVANPPGMSSFFGWFSRDHRKLITIDRSQAFISGLCIGDAWIGKPEKKIPPWRDTGVEICGPAVADVEAAFAAAWKLTGGLIPSEELPRREDLPKAGSISLRIVPASPETTGIYRLDLMLAATVRQTLWLTDAYFIATSPYIQALRASALDGVDVRLLVPHGSDIPWVASFSRTMYRSLLEAGVRVFEWNGSMVHAKTAVADGRLSRIGSTNLNISSWIGNWEMDVVIEDEELAREMSEMFLADLAQATEIVIGRRNKVRPIQPLSRRKRLRVAKGSGRGVLSGMARIGSALNAAVTGKRILGRAESSSLLKFGMFICFLTFVAFYFPRIISYTVGGLLGWTGFFILVKAIRLRYGNQDEEVENIEPKEKASSDKAR
ncbi:MAG: cardiolipin synthase B [Deltaproteobacteria bacterium]|nr:MAG: cardiolipin synthase B [Deltaproteobacteria bacterium]